VRHQRSIGFESRRNDRVTGPRGVPRRDAHRTVRGSFECIEIAFSIVYALLQDFNCQRRGVDADVARRHDLCRPVTVLKVLRIFECLTIVLKSNFPAFELSPQL